ncbi:MAG: flagellar motor protein MotB [Planctomycetota bacterium]
MVENVEKTKKAVTRWRTTSGDLSERPWRTHAWILTYGDMVSLLVVFFVLVYASSKKRPAEIDRRQTRAVGLQNIVHGTPLTRHSNYPGSWTPLGHLIFEVGEQGFDRESWHTLENRFLPHILATSAQVVVLCSGIGVTHSSDPDGDTWHRAKLVRDYLSARYVDKERVFILASSGREVFRSLKSQGRPQRPHYRVQLYLAPTVQFNEKTRPEIARR